MVWCELRNKHAGGVISSFPCFTLKGTEVAKQAMNIVKSLEVHGHAGCAAIKDF